MTVIKCGQRAADEAGAADLNQPGSEPASDTLVEPTAEALAAAAAEPDDEPLADQAARLAEAASQRRDEDL